MLTRRNSEIRGLITTGKGRAFSTGLDVQWMKTQTPTALDHYHEELHALYKRILSLGVVTVAAVNGNLDIQSYPSIFLKRKRLSIFE